MPQARRRVCARPAALIQADDVAVALSNAEFFERRGPSLGGSFVAAGELAQDVDSGKV